MQLLQQCNKVCFRNNSEEGVIRVEILAPSISLCVVEHLNEIYFGWLFVTFASELVRKAFKTPSHRKSLFRWVFGNRLSVKGGGVSFLSVNFLAQKQCF